MRIDVSIDESQPYTIEPSIKYVDTAPHMMSMCQ